MQLLRYSGYEGTVPMPKKFGSLARAKKTSRFLTQVTIIARRKKQKKFETNSKTTHKQAADDIIMDALLGKDKSWEKIFNMLWIRPIIADEKVKNINPSSWA
jgi:hypothetical protein